MLFFLIYYFHIDVIIFTFIIKFLQFAAIQSFFY